MPDGRGFFSSGKEIYCGNPGGLQRKAAQYDGKKAGRTASNGYEYGFSMLKEEPSMQVTFLIGNGFDLNLGLKTRYTDFYPLYLGAPESDALDYDILQFKMHLSEDYSHWADFERALGEHTKEPPLNEQDTLRKCLQDFKRQFAWYLREEESRIDFNACADDMAKEFASCVFSHLDYLQPQPRNAIQEAFSSQNPLSRNDTYYILTFNYTTVIDRLASHIDPSDFPRSSVGRVVHVHGTHTAGMIMGVDNLEQVANPGLFTSPRQQRLLLKPLINQQSGPDNDRNALDCIRYSNEICIFGMSLGVTDAIWWRRIGKWLTGKPVRQLVIFSRSHDLDPLLPESILDYQDSVQDRFFAQTEIPPENWDDFRDQVHIALNTDIFNLDPVFKVPLIGNPSSPAPAAK